MTDFAISQVTPEQIAAAFARARRFHAGLAVLAKRGLSRRLLAELADSGEAAMGQVEVLLDWTVPAPVPTWRQRTTLRVRRLFRPATPDPFLAARDRFARRIAAINTAADRAAFSSSVLAAGVRTDAGAAPLTGPCSAGQTTPK